jgi:hypothetical protein
VSTVSPTSRHDLTDAQWAVLVPLLPPPTGRGRARQYPLRGLVDGARYRARVAGELSSPLPRTLSTETRFRGPLVAQTSIRRLAQPCGAAVRRGLKVPANEADRGSSSPRVVVPDPACHAGGRGFESRRSRKIPANQ